MKNKVIGIMMFLTIVAAAFFIQDLTRKGKRIPGLTSGRIEVLKGYIGSEKAGFLENEDVKRILEKRHGLQLDYSKAGSIEMIGMPLGQDIDFLWPSSQVALELYKLVHGGEDRKSEIIFSSPIVFYSWDMVTEAMIKEGLLTESKHSLDLDLPRLIELVRRGADWADIGLPDLYGGIRMISTDPVKSNSGNMFSGLIANILIGDVATEAAVEQVLPEIKSIFDKLGYMIHSTGILFDQYLRTGVGSYPLIVGYENQIVEFSLEHREFWPKVKDKIRILYPVPTVWSAHPVIALTPRSRKLIDALLDPDLQRLAWEKHGFRTGVMGVDNDPEILNIVGIPETITRVMPMPTPQVMNRIIQTLKGLDSPQKN